MECPDCGDSFKGENGVKTHARFTDCDVPDSWPDENVSELAQAVFERDEVCRGCGSEETTVASIRDSEELSSFVAVCESCADKIEGLRPRTKRTVLQRQGK